MPKRDDADTRADAEVLRRSILRGTTGSAESQAVLARQYTAAEDCYVAWLNGVPHPDDAIYADIWEGRLPGMGKRHIEMRLAKQKKMRQLLASGEKAPSEIVGTVAYGNTPEMILRNLDRGIAEYEEAMRCQGRNLSINQARARQVRESRNAH